MDDKPAAGSFEEALSAAAGEAEPEAAGTGPERLAQVRRAVALQLPVVDNLGCSGDGRDLYTHLDALAGAARAVYPEIPCRAGCSACCHYPTSLYTIAAAEWRPMAAHVMETWPPERLVAFVRRFWETHGPYMARLRLVDWLMSIPLPIAPRREGIPLACPFLEDDRCAVYDVRPAQARAFGLFAIKHFWLRKPIVYGCELSQEQLSPLVVRGDRPGLPSFNPLYGVRGALARGRQRLIPLWVARQWPRSWLRQAERDLAR